MSRVQILREAMTAEELSAVQSEHYTLDDHMRRMMGRLTADQKRRVVDLIRSMLPKEG